MAVIETGLAAAPRMTRGAWAAAAALVAVVASVLATVYLTIPDEAEVAAVGAEAGLPSLVRAPRPPVDGLVRPADTAHLAAFFQELGFDLDLVREGAAPVPRVYVTALPEDLHQLRSIEERKALFLRSVLPLVLMANEELRSLRARIEDLRDRLAAGGPLSAEDGAWLDRVSERYGVARSNKLDRLLRRVDVIPVSLALAQSIEESGWGTSRFARRGNALYGQRIWSRGPAGMVPGARPRGQSFRVRSYLNLMGAVRAYMHNLNTHPAYTVLRAERARRRAAGGAPDGHTLAGTLVAYSERGEDYVAQLRRLINGNDLTAFDEARLTDAASS